MKCGVLTFHRAQNYGAILQAYALQKSIHKIGVDCELVDYRCPFIEKYFQPFSIKSFKNFKKIAAIVLLNGRVIDNRSNFEDFINNYLKTSSEVITSSDELDELNSIYDTFITGSDQVWSYLTAGFDKSFFLDFVDDKNKKNAYAASFGVEKLPDELKLEYKKLLSNFANISVREEQGADIVKELLEIEPLVVLDPTLLLDKNEWLKISSGNYEEQEYLLLYVIAESKSILDLARKIARKNNLKIVYINDRLYKRFGMENKSKLKVTDWVSLFLNAKYIVTNSFHGVAFSINFQKEFFMKYLPEPAKVNSRLQNILDLFELEDRHVKNLNCLDQIERIDYVKVNRLLEVERKKSIEYLNSIFTNCIDK